MAYLLYIYEVKFCNFYYFSNLDKVKIKVITMNLNVPINYFLFFPIFLGFLI